MKPTRPLKIQGYVACSPEGVLSRCVADTISYAKTEAAMSFRGNSMCTMPSDWNAARSAGWRVYCVNLVPHGRAA